MTDAVVEKVEVEAGADEVFRYWSNFENVCALVREAEETRRVDLSASWWNLKGPTGSVVRFGPQEFRLCRNRERLAERRSEGVSGPSSPDLLLGDLAVECKRLSAHRTLLFVSYDALEGAAGASRDERKRRPEEDAGSSGRLARTYLDLHTLLARLFYESWRDVGFGTVGGDDADEPEEGTRPAEQESAGSVDGLVSLLEQWAAEDPGYDEETLRDLKENLDRNRPEYRKIFGRG